jgi:hypothetical protein
MAVVHSQLDQTVATEKAAFNAQKALVGLLSKLLLLKKCGCRILYKLSPSPLIQASAVAFSSSPIMECV